MRKVSAATIASVSDTLVVSGSAATSEPSATVTIMS